MHGFMFEFAKFEKEFEKKEKKPNPSSLPSLFRPSPATLSLFPHWPTFSFLFLTGPPD
jgi:hypothetical protein